MPQPLPADYLQEDERVIHQARRQPLSVVDEVLAGFLLATVVAAGTLVATLGFFPALFLPLAVPVLAAVVLLLGVFLLTRWLRVKTTLYTVTDQRVYKAFGRFRFFLSQTTYDKLTDLHLRQSFFGRLRGFGTVRLETAGTGIALDGVHDPVRVKRLVEEARTAFLHVLVGEAPKQASAPRPAGQEEAPRPVGDDAVWSAGPAPAAFLGNFIVMALMAVLAAGTLLAASLVGAQALLFPAVLGLFIVFQGLGIWVRLRHTRYNVTRRGVFITSGWLTRRRVETTFAKVTDVTVYQGFLGRILDHGTITINTAGSNMAPVVFAGVARPEQVKHLIDETRRSWERSA